MTTHPRVISTLMTFFIQYKTKRDVQLNVNTVLLYNSDGGLYCIFIENLIEIKNLYFYILFTPAHIQLEASDMV